MEQTNNIFNSKLMLRGLCYIHCTGKFRKINGFLVFKESTRNTQTFSSFYSTQNRNNKRNTSSTNRMRTKNPILYVLLVIFLDLIVVFVNISVKVMLHNRLLYGLESNFKRYNYNGP